MSYPSYHPILNDFDTSIILPFYKKLHDFKRILPLNAPFFQRNGIEVILVMDEAGEQDGVLDLLRQYPLINWKFIVNTHVHSWRNPCKALNVGIKASGKRYIMVCSPESKFHTDAIFRLRYMTEHHSPCFTIGRVFFGRYDMPEDTSLSKGLPYGSILVKKEYLEKVGAYSEFYDHWGGEDNNLRAKLEYIGIKKIYVDDAVLIHYEEDEQGHHKRELKAGELPESIIRRSFYPAEDDFTNEGWGTDFGGRVYDYCNNQYSEDLCKDHLRGFKKFEICRAHAFTKEFKIIALIQTHNEKAHVPEVLTHLDEICDGIILLDDESTDGTYELGKSDKLLLKVQKQRKEFNDLENRNQLLDIASFFKTDWLFFIDADERFDSRYNNLTEIVEFAKSPSISFRLINTWNSPQMYRTDLVDSVKYSLNGIFSRPRMFRNTMGRVQIILKDKRKLHFSPIPINMEIKPEKILLIHYGLQDKAKREEKCRFYRVEDDYEKRNLDEYYKYMMDDSPRLAFITDINL